MVCRDSKTHKSHPVNPLVVETEEDKQLWRMGEGMSTIFFPIRP